MSTNNIEAAVKDLLRNFPPGAKVDVNFTSEGITFTVVEPTKQQILEKKYGAPIGQPITLTEASEKYGIPRSTLQSWQHRANYITPINTDTYPAQFDEAEIAYIADIYNQRRNQRSRAPLLDENGLPYQIKDPERAAKVRKVRAQNRDS